MGFLVVNKQTGDVIFDKIYKTEGRAQAIINQGLRKGNVGKTHVDDLVVIKMPSASVLKDIANGSGYGTVTYKGRRYPFTPIDFGDE